MSPALLPRPRARLLVAQNDADLYVTREQADETRAGAGRDPPAATSSREAMWSLGLGYVDRDSLARHRGAERRFLDTEMR
jgi:hypothetical protein